MKMKLLIGFVVFCLCMEIMLVGAHRFRWYDRLFKRAAGEETCVANAYHKPVFVLVDGNRELVVKASKDIGLMFVGTGSGYGERSERAPIHVANSTGFTAVDARSHTCFSPLHNGIIYVSVYTVDGKNKTTIAMAHKLRAGESAIVDKYGFIHTSKKGETWVDENNKNHSDYGAYIANAYHSPLLVMMDGDKKRLANKAMNLVTFNSTTGSDIKYKANDLGFKHIDMTSETYFEQDLKEYFYLAIFSIANGKLKMLTTKTPFEVKNGRSVIVTRQGDILIAKKDCIWEDEGGKDHSNFHKIIVANAFPSSIFVTIHGDQKRLFNISQNVEEFREYNFETDAKNNGFKEISRRSHLSFEEPERAEKCYISIYWIDDGTGKTVAKAAELRECRSFIVGRDKTIHYSKYDAIWVDEHDNNHFEMRQRIAVANALPSQIFVKLGGNEKKLTELSRKFRSKIHHGVQFKHEDIFHEFTVIDKRLHLFLEEPENSGTIFICIFTRENGTMRNIVEATPIQGSVILGRDEALHKTTLDRRAGYWIDEQGTNHYNPPRIYVANAFTSALLVRMDGNKSNLSKVSQELEKSEARDSIAIYKKARSLGFEGVAIGGSNFIETDNMSTVYISIFTIDSESYKLGRMKEAYELEEGRSVIVAKDGSFHYSKVDEIWTDENGKDHTRNLLAEYEG